MSTRNYPSYDRPAAADRPAQAALLRQHRLARRERGAAALSRGSGQGAGIMKRRSKLTPEQQQLVSQALPHALSIARKHAWRYGPSLDFEGAVALWLCQEIAKFDPKKGSLKTWASCHGHFACRNLMRAEDPVKSRRKSRRKARFISLESTFDQNGVSLSEQIAAPAEHQ